jgi:hypothetical protein
MIIYTIKIYFDTNLSNKMRKISLATVALLGSVVYKDQIVNAITEEPDKITMRDAGATKDRPSIEGYDMNDDDKKTAD